MRLAHAVVLAGKESRLREVLERLQVEGMLTDDLLDVLLKLPGIPPPIISKLNEYRSTERGMHPHTTGTVWTLSIAEPYVLTGPDGQKLAIPSLVNFYVSAKHPVPTTTVRTREWSKPGSSLVRLLAVVDRVVCDFSPFARPGWTVGHAMVDLTTMGRPIDLRETDRSYELAVSVAAISSALDVELEIGTVALGIVCCREEEAKSLKCDIGAVLPLGDENVWIKLAGIVHALPIASKILASHQDAEFIRAHLPKEKRETIEVVALQNIRDLPLLFEADPNRFRGRRKPQRWKQARILLRRLLNVGVTPIDAIQRELSVRRDEARARFGSMLGEQCAIPAFLCAMLLADTLSPTRRWISSCTAAFLCPVVLMVLLGGGSRLLGLGYTEDRFTSKVRGIEMPAPPTTDANDSRASTNRTGTPTSEFRVHVAKAAACWIIWLTATIAFWGGSVLDENEWRLFSILPYMLSALFLGWKEMGNHDERYLVFELPALLAFQTRWAWVSFLAGVSCLFVPARAGLAFSAAAASIYIFLTPAWRLVSNDSRQIAQQLYRYERSRRAAIILMGATALIPFLTAPAWLMSLWHSLSGAWSGAEMNTRVYTALLAGLIGLRHYHRGLFNYSRYLAPSRDEILLRGQELAGIPKRGFPSIDILRASQGITPVATYADRSGKSGTITDMS